MITRMQAWLADLNFTTALLVSVVGSTALTLISVAQGYLIEWIFRDRKIFDIPLKPRQLRKEAVGTLLWHLLWCPLLALILVSGWLRFGEGLARELLTFVGCIFAFQAYYYFLHRAMHLKPLMFMHRWHHDSLVTTPLTGFSMHPLEGVGWCVGFFGPALLASVVTEIGAIGFLSFLAFSWYGNIVGHANVEFMPKVTATRGYSRVISNPISYHSLHHARFKGHFGFATSWADELFGSQFPDWIAVAKRVQSGQPLQKLNERAGAPVRATLDLSAGA
jgi:lathosterol oxidase